MKKGLNKRGLLIVLCASAIVCTTAVTAMLYKNRPVKVENNTLVLKQGDNKISIQVCNEEILRVHYIPLGKENPHTEVVGNTEWKKVKASFDTKSNPIIIKTDKITAKIDKETMKISVYDVNNKLLVEDSSGSSAFVDTLTFNHAQEDSFYGGRGFDAWEDSGDKMLRSSVINIEAGKQGYAGGPLIWSTKGYGLLVDTVSGRFNIKSEEIEFSEPSKPDVEYYVMTGNPNEIIEAVASISGKAPMFPKWAMGFTNSEWGIDQKELNDIVNTYRNKNIPIDNYTLDFDWKAWGEDNYGEFRWNTVKFPDGASGKLQRDMESKGIKLTGIMKPRLHIDTEQGKYAEDHNYWYPDKAPYSDYFSKKLVSDVNFALPEVRKWYFDHIKDAYNTGIVGWWNDEADEGFDSMQHLNMQKALYEGQRGISNNRVWSINRNFFTGAQKYAYGMWSGDIRTGEYSMAMQRERMLSAINLGQAKWGMDTGGFSGTPEPENYARWMQFSAFTPIFRVHGSGDEQRQPWIYGETAEKASKDVMQLRYKLIPYIYSYERRSYESGLGLVKPLFYDYPQDKNLENYTDAWMFGDYLLVSPVVTLGVDSKSIYLPEGTWIDYFTGERLAGGRKIEHKVDKMNWSDVPLYIKKGAIIASQDFMNYVGEKPIKNIYLDIFPDKEESSFRYYDDDGKTYDYEKGVYFIQNITAKDNGDSSSINLSGKEGSFVPELQNYIVKMHGRDGSKVISKGNDLKKYNSLEDLMNSSEEGYAVEKDIYGSVTYIKLTAGLEKDVQVYGAADLQ